MILLPAIVAGIGVALVRGGSFRPFAAVPLRLGWLAILCLLAQMYVIYSPADRLEAERTLHAILLTGSYLALCVVVWANRRITGIPLIGVGLLLNLAVMVANGGFMPVSREAILTAGTRSAQEIPAEGARLSRSKDILLPAERTHLWLLSDVIVSPPIPVSRVYSLGDLVVGLGAFMLIQAAMVPGKERRAGHKSRLNAA